VKPKTCWQPGITLPRDLPGGRVYLNDPRGPWSAWGPVGINAGAGALVSATAHWAAVCVNRGRHVRLATPRNPFKEVGRA